MKKKILLITSVVAIGSCFLSSYKEGPASYGGYDCTGAEVATTGATATTGCYASRTCHNSTASTTITCTIKLDSAGGVSTTRYVPGMTYTVTMTGNNTSGSNTYYGFQLTSIKGTASAATVTNAGTFASTGLPAHVQLTPPQSGFTFLNILEHSAAISAGGSTFTQSFVWTAPAAGTGNISFWGACNWVNNDGAASSADIWNTGSLQVTEEAPLSINAVTNAENISAYPNPVSGMLSIAINGEQGEYQVVAYDLGGKMMMGETINTSNSGIAGINTASWRTGMYYIHIIKNGNTVKVIPIVKD